MLVTMPLYTLSKNERLKSLKRIKYLFEQGEKFKVSPLVVYYQLHKAQGGLEDKFPLKMGVSVGSKYFKKAVDRNLMKRRIREAFRKQKIPLQEKLRLENVSMDLFFVYAHASLVDFQVIWGAMEASLERLSSILEKSKS